MSILFQFYILFSFYNFGKGKEKNEMGIDSMN